MYGQIYHERLRFSPNNDSNGDQIISDDFGKISLRPFRVKQNVNPKRPSGNMTLVSVGGLVAWNLTPTHSYFFMSWSYVKATKFPSSVMPHLGLEPEMGLLRAVRHDASILGPFSFFFLTAFEGHQLKWKWLWAFPTIWCFVGALHSSKQASEGRVRIVLCYWYLYPRSCSCGSLLVWCKILTLLVVLDVTKSHAISMDRKNTLCQHIYLLHRCHVHARNRVVSWCFLGIRVALQSRKGTSTLNRDGP